jgi:hypothetical protein
LKYEQTAVTDGLFAIGQILLNEGLDRTKQLDAKAMSVTGYGAGILAIMVSAFSARAPTIAAPAWVFIVCSGWAVVVAIGLGLWAVRIADYYWISDFDWFGGGKLADADKLKRFHVLVLHGVKRQHEQINSLKASRLRRAYGALGVAGFLLAVALVLQALLAR